MDTSQKEHGPDISLQQIRPIYEEDDQPLFNIRKRITKLMILSGTLLAIAGLAFISIVRFPEQIQTSCILKLEKDERIFKFPHPVYVLKTYVEIGTQVETGVPLVQITSPEIVRLTSEYRDILSQMQAFSKFELNANINLLNIIAAEKKQLEQSINALAKEMKTQTESKNARIEQLQKQKEIAEQTHTIQKKLFDEGLLSRLDYFQYEKNASDAAKSLEIAQSEFKKTEIDLTSKVELYNTDLEKLGNKKYGTIIEYEKQLNQLQLRLTAINQELHDIYGEYSLADDGSITLKAPTAGTVSYLFQGEKEVSSGAILLKMRQGQSSFYCSTSITADKIGKIKSGQPAHIRVHSLPFYDYGVISAKIHSISMSPDENGSFPITIQILDFAQTQTVLQPGMSADVSIITAEKTLLGYWVARLKTLTAE